MNESAQEDHTAVSGFTLLEVLIAVVILATVLSTVFASYTSTFRVIGDAQSQLEVYDMARSTLHRIVEDLESCYISQKALSDKDAAHETDLYDFEGSETEIRFCSWAHVGFGEEDRSWGMGRIAYTVEEREPPQGLVLLRSDTFYLEDSSAEQDKGFPLCEGLQAVQFKFIDSEGEENLDWEKDADRKDRIPQRVSVSLDFANPGDPEKPFRFFTTVGLPISETTDTNDDTR